VEGGHVTNSRSPAGRRAEATQLPANQPGTKAPYDAKDHVAGIELLAERREARNGLGLQTAIGMSDL
jgi:hypothetical protein